MTDKTLGHARRLRGGGFRQLVTLLLGLLIGFWVAGTTTAAAATFTYDAPAIARVDVQRFGYAESSPAHASGSREWYASPSVQARGASTTSSRSFVATEAVGWSRCRSHSGRALDESGGACCDG